MNLEKKRFSLRVFISLTLMITTIILSTLTAWAKPTRINGCTFGGYTGTAETVNNDFNYKNNMDGDIRIIEPNWDPVDKKNITPNQKFVKDPKVRNTSDFMGYAFIRIKMPTIFAKRAGDTEYKTYDVFIPEWNTTDYELIYEKVSTVPGEDSVYYYGLKKPLRVGEYSPYLFKTVKMQNFTNAEASSDSITVDAAITSKVNPFTEKEYANVRAAFEVLGDYVPTDYLDYIRK